MLIGTAGHIDHGKSTLVHALTGIHPSRLPEEKKRAMTIDLGYAYMEHLEGHLVGFIDVPGHEKLIKNMVAGATGMETALLIVDALEGPKPQTTEHLQILQLLNIAKVIPILTKIEGVESETLEQSESKLRNLLENTPYSNEKIFRVDSITGKGMEPLKSTLLNLSKSPESDPKQKEPSYLAIDRCFALRGSSTIVTGTLTQGTLEKGQEVEIFPLEKTFRVKSLQNHFRKTDILHPVCRAAIELPGAPGDKIKRGMVLQFPGSHPPTQYINCLFNSLKPSASHKNGDTYILHMGTTETPCKVWFDETRPYIQIALKDPYSFHQGQKYILRKTNPLSVIGGGQVLDSSPDLKRHISPQEQRAYDTGAKDTNIGKFLSEYLDNPPQKSWWRVSQLARKFLASPEEVLQWGKQNPNFQAVDSGEENNSEPLLVYVQGVIHNTGDKGLKLETGFTTGKEELSLSEIANHLELPIGVAQFALSRIYESDLGNKSPWNKWKWNGKTLSRSPAPSSLSHQEKQIAERVLHRLKIENGESTFYSNFKKGYIRELSAFNRVLKHLRETGQIVSINREYFLLAPKHQELRDSLKQFAKREFSVSEFGKLHGLSRKFTLPILEYWDEKGLTQRQGKGRVVVGKP